jgi:hypothetical protein
MAQEVECLPSKYKALSSKPHYQEKVVSRENVKIFVDIFADVRTNRQESKAILTTLKDVKENMLAMHEKRDLSNLLKSNKWKS